MSVKLMSVVAYGGDGCLTLVSRAMSRLSRSQFSDVRFISLCDYDDQVHLLSSLFLGFDLVFLDMVESIVTDQDWEDAIVELQKFIVCPLRLFVRRGSHAETRF